MSEEPLRSYAEAADWLGVKQRWLEDQVRQHGAPHARLGKHVRFSQAHLNAIVAAGESRSNPEPAAATMEQSKSRRPVVVGRRQRQRTS